jgi:hypothetical protein
VVERGVQVETADCDMPVACSIERRRPVRAFGWPSSVFTTTRSMGSSLIVRFLRPGTAIEARRGFDGCKGNCRSTRTWS